MPNSPVFSVVGTWTVLESSTELKPGDGERQFQNVGSLILKAYADKAMVTFYRYS